MTFLAALENSGFGTWVRESGSLWSYPTILFLHTLGLSMLVGPHLAIDLRVLGVGSDAPLEPMDNFFRVMWAGFWINAASGVALLVADATTKLINPTFYVKMGFIALAVATMVTMRRRLFRASSGDHRSATHARALAWVSIACWAGAITAGRLMAYLGPISGVPGLTNGF